MALAFLLKAFVRSALGVPTLVELWVNRKTIREGPLERFWFKYLMDDCDHELFDLIARRPL